MIDTISVIIHTFNEEKNILSCIDSAKNLTERILVIDMNSTDKTCESAKEAGASIETFPYSSYVEPAREFGISKAKTKWVFLLDADERITKELAKEITTVISSQHSVTRKLKTDNRQLITAYKIPRKNMFGNKQWIKYGGWWPDYQIRLINKEYFKSWSKDIHSTPSIEGETGYLQSPLIHYSHRDLESMVEKTIEFEDVESNLLYKASRQVSTLTFFRKFWGELYRRLIRQLGFLDGEIGIIESIYQAFSKTITYLYLYEKKNRSSVRSLP